mmetsp:Transcript_126595/g.300707  ORF Transcript_126595/g.300707 Transcript_126595/m.300707 type:complete len:258 (-) Transcript_126595:1211-1984(-)
MPGRPASHGGGGATGRWTCSPGSNREAVPVSSAGHSGDEALGGPLLCSGACSWRCFSIRNITAGSCWTRCSHGLACGMLRAPSKPPFHSTAACHRWGLGALCEPALSPVPSLFRTASLEIGTAGFQPALLCCSSRPDSRGEPRCCTRTPAVGSDIHVACNWRSGGTQHCLHTFTGRDADACWNSNFGTDPWSCSASYGLHLRENEPRSVSRLHAGILRRCDGNAFVAATAGAGCIGMPNDVDCAAGWASSSSVQREC